MKFVKGKSGNLKGRPKSAYNGGTDSITELKKFVSKNSKRAFKILWKAVEAKESWALQIFFQELVPKLETLPLEIDQDNPDKIEATIAGILKAFAKLETITVDEACKLLGTLNHLKFIEGLLKQRESLQDLLTEEQYRTFKLWVKEAEMRKIN
jgi:hypothetical protein